MCVSLCIGPWRELGFSSHGISPVPFKVFYFMPASPMWISFAHRLLLDWIMAFEDLLLLACNFRSLPLRKEGRTSPMCPGPETLRVASARTEEEIRVFFPPVSWVSLWKIWKGKRTKDRTRVLIENWACRQKHWETERKRGKGMTHWNWCAWMGLSMNFTYFLVIFCLPNFLQWACANVPFEQTYYLRQTQLAWHSHSIVF